jgi:hypothetical protein
MSGDVSFKDFLEHMKRETATDLPVDAPKPSAVPEMLEEKPAPLSIVPNAITIQELLAKAEENGFKVADIVTGAKVYHNQSNIYRLTPEQIADLDRRISARIEKMKETETDAPQAVAKQASATNEATGNARTQPTRNLKRA